MTDISKTKRELLLSAAAGLTATAAALTAMATLDEAEAQPAGPKPAEPNPPPQTTAQKAYALANSGYPTVSVGSVDVPRTAKVAYVPVSIDKPAVVTLWLDVQSRNGQGANYAYADGQFKHANAHLCWKPGDPLVQYVAVPLMGNAGEGQHFQVVIPSSAPRGAKLGATVGKVTFKAAAPPQETPPAYAALPLRTPSKGALVYEFKPSAFKASDKGGAGVWRTRLSHGRTQPDNGEVGYYTDPTLQPGTKAHEVRPDGILVLRAEKFMQPLRVQVGPGKFEEWDYGSSVLQADWISQRYGYFEWDVMLPTARGTWDGLWLLPADGSWPPEIDVSESPRNGEFGPGDTSASNIWDKARITLLLNARKIFNDPTFDMTTAFHKRAVDWREDWTTMYIDDREVARFPTTFHKAAFPVMDVAVGGPWAGPPDFSKGSTELLVRGFKIYK